MLLIAELVSWLKLLPNVAWLNAELSELKCWLNEETMVDDLHFFLERLELISVNCASMDESMLDKLLAFFVKSGHFCRMRRLCFVECPNLSISSGDARRWMDLIFARPACM